VFRPAKKRNMTLGFIRKDLAINLAFSPIVGAIMAWLVCDIIWPYFDENPPSFVLAFVLFTALHAVGRSPLQIGVPKGIFEKKIEE
jgi:hypothetical protein